MDAREVLEAIGAPARLLRHAELVSEAAAEILAQVRSVGVAVDEAWVLTGAMLHDAGSMTCSLEELLVALADTLWKGVRRADLEGRVIAFREPRQCLRADQRWWNRAPVAQPDHDIPWYKGSVTKAETIGLVIAAVAFLAFMLWRVRPRLGGGRQPLRAVLKDARARIDAAKDDEEKALALCDAGDACAAAVGRKGEAAQFYLRAMRQLPSSVPILERACHGLSRNPRVLEKLLWRRLGSEAWSGGTLPTARMALKALAVLYSHSLHDHVRARAIEHAVDALERVS